VVTYRGLPSRRRTEDEVLALFHRQVDEARRVAVQFRPGVLYEAGP
jgi:hypothetical protein